MEPPSSYVCYKQKRNNLRETTWMIAIIVMPEKHCIGVTLNDDNNAEEFLLSGDHRSRSMLCGNGALAVSSYSEHAAKSSLEDSSRSGCDRGS